jgi:NAD(P)-dependent dehydrogenase (short-subunit alcohol dehydrogenase family)
MTQPTLKTAFITGADRGLGLALCAGLLQKGWCVFAGQYMPEWTELDHLAVQFPGQLTTVPLDVSSRESTQAAARQVGEITEYIDLLVNNAGILIRTHDRSIREEQDYAGMQTDFDINALGPLRIVEAFLPLVEKSTVRRLCVVSSEAGSITNSTRTSWFGYCMSKAAVNMAFKNLFNDLRPQGYTFRIYHPGWMRTYMSGQKNMNATLEPEEAAAYALAYFLSGIEPGNPAPEEDHLVLRDYLGQEYPW